MKTRQTISLSLMLFLMACALPLLAQSTANAHGKAQPQVDPNEIFCANGTASKARFVPLFATRY